MDERYKSISQVYEMTGMDRRTIKKRMSGLIMHSKHGKAEYYDMCEVLPRLYAPESNTGDVGKQLLEEQLRSESARADKLRIEADRMAGDVVAIEDVCRTVGKEYTYVRAAILSLPSKMAKPMAIEDDPETCRALLKKEVDEILNHLQADVKLNIEPEEVDEKYFPEEAN